MHIQSALSTAGVVPASHKTFITETGLGIHPNASLQFSSYVFLSSGREGKKKPVLGFPVLLAQRILTPPSRGRVQKFLFKKKYFGNSRFPPNFMKEWKFPGVRVIYGNPLTHPGFPSPDPLLDRVMGIMT